jgi:hypothetical protein
MAAATLERLGGTSPTVGHVPAAHRLALRVLASHSAGAGGGCGGGGGGGASGKMTPRRAVAAGKVMGTAAPVPGRVRGSRHLACELSDRELEQTPVLLCMRTAPSTRTPHASPRRCPPAL